MRVAYADSAPSCAPSAPRLKKDWEAAYAASIGSVGFHSCGFRCQLATADSLQPALPGDMATDHGRFGAQSSRKIHKTDVEMPLQHVVFL